MKKKLALLLAVSMVLSMLPMNVFGRAQAPGPSPTWGVANPVATEAYDNVLVTVNLDLANFLGKELDGNLLPLRVTLNGGDSRLLGLAGNNRADDNGFAYGTAYQDPLDGANAWRDKGQDGTVTAITAGSLGPGSLIPSRGNVSSGKTTVPAVAGATLGAAGTWGGGPGGPGVPVFPSNSGYGSFEVRYWQGGGDTTEGLMTLLYLGPTIPVAGVPTGVVPSVYPDTNASGTSGGALGFGQVSIPINFNLRIRAGATLTITYANPADGSAPLFSGTVATLDSTSGITITPGDRVDFHSTTALRRITIAETGRGALTPVVTGNLSAIVLELPRYYKWHVGSIQGQLNTLVRSRYGTFQNIGTGDGETSGNWLSAATQTVSSGPPVASTTAGRLSDVQSAFPYISGGTTYNGPGLPAGLTEADARFLNTRKLQSQHRTDAPIHRSWYTETFENGLRERLVIFLNTDRSASYTGPANAVRDEIWLENLWIVAEDRAAMNNVVTVSAQFRMDDWNPEVSVNRTNWPVRNIDVAYRTTNSLNLTLAGEPNSVRSGSLGGDLITDPTTKDFDLRGKTFAQMEWRPGSSINGDTNALWPVTVVPQDSGGGRSFYEGVKAQTIVLKEDAPNSWSSTFGTATEFSFDDPSIRILGARVWLVIPDKPDWASSDWLESSSWAWQGWVNARNGQYPSSPTSVTLSPDMLRVFYPTQNVSDVRWSRELRVELYLSIEAGYQWKHGGDSRVSVTVGGAGVGNLAEGDRTLVIANAIDPVEVTNAGRIEIPTGSTYFTGRTPIEDIVITENPDFRFEVGNELWVYVIGDGRRTDVTFTCDDIATVNNAEDTGLRLRRGYRLHHPNANFWLDGMVFVIERESWSNEPASFTLTNAAISGQIYPGVDYKVVVSGPAVAQNDQYVFSAQADGLAAGGQISVLTVGAFYRDPYEVAAVGFAERITDDGTPGTGTGTVGGGNEGPGTGAVVVPNLVLPTLFTNQPTMPSNVENPLIFRHNTTGTGYEVSYVAVAAFLDLLRAVYGVDSVPTNDQAWNDATQTATIYGPHKQGYTVTVELTVGSTIVTINGVPMDIADSVGGASGPSGTIPAINVNNRNYLPLRCLAQAFGWVPALEGNAVTFR